MTKPKSKPKAATRSTARKTAKPASRKRSAPASSRLGSRTRYQARPHHRDAADACGRNDRSHHDCHGMAATFGARLPCRCRPQEARPQPCFRTNRQGSGLSHQGWQGFVCSCGPRQAGGLMRCGRNVAMVVPRPKHPLRTRSRICAVSISGDYVHDGRACFKDRRPLICRGICCLRSSPIGSRPIASAISITRPGRCWIDRLRRKQERRCPPVSSASTRSEPS